MVMYMVLLFIILGHTNVNENAVLVTSNIYFGQENIEEKDKGLSKQYYSLG